MAAYARRLALLAVALVGLAGCSPAGPREASVTLIEFSIRASTRTFSAGIPYRLQVTNRGQVNHELRIGPPGTQGDPDEIAWVDEMTLQPGATTTLDVVFPQSVAGTALELSCYLPAHYAFGMHLAVMIGQGRTPVAR